MTKGERDKGRMEILREKGRDTEKDLFSSDSLNGCSSRAGLSQIQEPAISFRVPFPVTGIQVLCHHLVLTRPIAWSGLEEWDGIVGSNSFIVLLLATLKGTLLKVCHPISIKSN